MAGPSVIALDPDVERLRNKLPYSRYGRPSLSLWLVHDVGCYGRGLQGGTCTCGLLVTLDRVRTQGYRWSEWEQTWIPSDDGRHRLGQVQDLAPWVHHMEHCDHPKGGNCCCGLHTAWPELWRI